MWIAKHCSMPSFMQRVVHFLSCSWENRLEYAKAVLEYRLQELSCEARVSAIKTGLATIVPVHVLTMLNPRDLEIRTCGIPNVDIDFLKVTIFPFSTLFP